MASADDVVIKLAKSSSASASTKAIGWTFEIEFPKEVVPDPKDSLEIDLQYVDPSNQLIPQATAPRTVVVGPTQVSDTTGEMVGSGKVHAYVSFVQERFAGRLGLRLAWKHGDQSFERIDRRDAGSPLNDAKNLPVVSDEPRLFEKIGKPTGATLDPLPPGADAADDGRFGWRGFAVGRVLDHVHTYLRWGLGSYWHGFGGDRLLDGVPMCELPDAKLDGLTLAQLEECWAQHVTEALTKCPYEGAGSFMGAAIDTSVAGVSSIHQRDATVVKKMREHRASDEAFYPIIFACQQLVTAAVFFRGHFEIADNPADAVLWGTTGNVTGAERKTGSKLTPVTGAKLEEHHWLRPGVCMFRGKADGTAIRHVGVLLRVNAGTKKYQLLDTGGWTTNSFGGGGSFDSAFLDTNHNVLNAVLAPPTDEGKLREGIRALRRSRPLAAAQLVIRRRGVASANASVYWASPLLHMHEGTGPGRAAYPITRLIASLRDLPFSAELDVRWQVYIPQGSSLAAAMDGVVPWWRPAGASPKATIEIGNKTDGSVVVHQRAAQDIKNNTHKLPSFVPPSVRKDFDGVPALDQSSLRGTYPELADMSGVEIPDYFKGTP